MDVRWVAHHLIAHPLLVLCPPLGSWLHDATLPDAYDDTFGFAVALEAPADEEPAAAIDLVSPVLGFRRSP